MRGQALFLRIVAASVLLGASSGCVIRHGDFTVLSNKLIRTADFDLSKADRKRAVGEDKMHIIVIIPTKGNITLEGAIDDALEKGDGDVLTDAVIHMKQWYIPYIYGQASWVVEGDVVKTRRR